MRAITGHSLHNSHAYTWKHGGPCDQQQQRRLDKSDALMKRAIAEVQAAASGDIDYHHAFLVILAELILLFLSEREDMYICPMERGSLALMWKEVIAQSETSKTDKWSSLAIIMSLICLRIAEHTSYTYYCDR